MVNNQLINRFYETYHRAEDIQAELDDLKTLVLDHMRINGITKLKSQFGIITLINRKTYEYSPKLNQAMALVLLKKKEEELRGIAQIKKETPYLKLISVGL